MEHDVTAASLLPAEVADEVADAMFALATPSRVQILRALMDGPCAVGPLADALGMEQSAVSHQLRILRDHHLIDAERHGRRRIYSLEDEHVADFFRAALRHVGHGLEPDRRSSRRAGTAPA